MRAHLLFCCLLLGLPTPSTLAQNASEPLWPGQPRTDYTGTVFQTQKAPTLSFERRLFPRLHGIDYPFAPQTARGALVKRFPPFTLSDRRIHTSGPWTNDPNANDFFSRGITSVETIPNYRLDPPGPTDIRRLSRENKWAMFGDPVFYIYARMLADELAAANANDPRIPALRLLADEHKMAPDQGAYLELGRRAWNGERAPTDAKGQGFKYVTLDIETTGGWEFQRQCLGWIYQGMTEAAAKDGLELVPINYGQWQYAVGAVFDSMRQNGTGEPEYLLPAKDPLPANDPTLQALNDAKGVVSMDGYLQAIWGGEPFYKRSVDGKLILQDGKPVFSDLRKTTLYGQEVSLEAGEAEHCLQDLYRQTTRMMLMHHSIAGEYPARSGMAKPFLKDVRIGAWSRYTNEGLMGIEQNDRPLPPWLFETLIGMYLFTADDIAIWSSDFNRVPGPLGADHSKSWKYGSEGVVEFLIKAAHRYSALEPIHHGPFEWCWFNLPTVNKNVTDGERFDQKPLAIGKIRQFEGKTWLEFFAAWPAVDGNPANIQIWVDQDGKKSPTYNVQLANGRSYFLDAWQLPEGFENLQGRDIWMRFTDQLGQTRTWRGDWRIAADQTVIAPAAFVAK